MNIKGQSFLKLLDFTPEQIMEFLALAAKLKAKKKAGISHRLCEGKQAALILKRPARAHAALLRLQRMIWA